MQRDLKSELAVSFLVSERKARKREERQVGTGKEARSKRRGAKSLSGKMREREREKNARLALGTSEISGETEFRFVSKNITQSNRSERIN